jgi:predicted RecA/RadA family phage recombinase
LVFRFLKIIKEVIKMKNFVLEGDVINYANSGSAIASGAVVQIGETVGVAATDISATTGTGAVLLEGVFSLPKVGSQAWSQGDKIFWDHTNLYCTSTPSSDADTVMGIAFEAVGSGSGETTGLVKLQSNQPKKAASESAVATADGSDAATTQALANALKVTVNSLIAKLKASGVMDN